MQVFTLAALDSEPSDPNTFVGQARPSHVYRVAFEAGARTNWHSHSGPQLLQIVEGRCRFQRAGAPVQEAEAGDLISFAPEERHWHGAWPNGPMTHIAINIDATTTWSTPVTDVEYLGE